MRVNPARFIGLVVPSQGASAPGGFRPQSILSAPKSVLHFQPKTPMPRRLSTQIKLILAILLAALVIGGCAASDGLDNLVRRARTEINGLLPKPVLCAHAPGRGTLPAHLHAHNHSRARHTYPGNAAHSHADPGASARGDVRQPLRLHPHVADLEQLRTRHPGHEPELLRQPPGSGRRGRGHASQPGRQECQPPRDGRLRPRPRLSGPHPGQRHIGSPAHPPGQRPP